MSDSGLVTSANRPRPRFTAQVLLGLMVIVVGVLFTLDNLNIIDAEQYLQYWPAGLVALGLLRLWHAAREGHGWFGGLFFVAVGTWMLIERITYIRIDAREIFPLFLVFIGGYLVWRGFGGVRRSAPSDGLTHFSSLAVMGGCARRSNAQAFEGADLTALMGGCDIDLRDASIAPNTEAVIDVFAFWGGIDLKVPEDWIVVNRVVPLMGGVDDKTRPPIAATAPQKRLVVRGIVLMGGVSIRNRSRRDDVGDALDAHKLRADIRRSIRDGIRDGVGEDDDRRS
jgi:cell wall-active antibiotic response 4TMS protein YvqF